MNRCSPKRVASATLGLAGLASVAVLLGTFRSTQSKVLFHCAILQLLGHPGLDVLVKLAAVDTTLLALLLSHDLPSGFESIRTNSSSVEGHLGTVNRAEDNVKVGVGKAETAGIDLIKIAEDLELELRRKGW